MRMARRVLYTFLPPSAVLIHTPKCAGSYINRQYRIHRQLRIMPVGHAQLRALELPAKTRVVGLIREPSDWYASYYVFARKSLTAAPQSSRNFPPHHPISVFSRNGADTLAQMLSNMACPEFLQQLLTNGISANVYGRSIDDIFGFMHRTRSGFWTWTMVHHFSRQHSQELQTASDVLQAARDIAREVGFIHQQRVDAGVEALLGLPRQQGERVNVSQHSPAQAPDGEVSETVRALDGEVARILGAGSVPAP
jgi:hypothetical protein